VSGWQKTIDVYGVECWELIERRALPVDAPPRPRWTVYAAHGKATLRNPAGVYWHGMRAGSVVRLNSRVRTWRTRAAAMGAVAELARREP